MWPFYFQRGTFCWMCCTRGLLVLDEEKGRLSRRFRALPWLYSATFPTRVFMAWPILCLDLHAWFQCVELSICASHSDIDFILELGSIYRQFLGGFQSVGQTSP